MQALCQSELNCQPRSGTLFVFINRSKTMVRALVYDGSGFWLMTKRLSKGKFQGWPSNELTVSSFDAKQLRALLLGKIQRANWQKMSVPK